MEEKKPVVLFVCVHNTARSQMAEGLLRHYGKDTHGNEIVDVKSCGTHPAPETHTLAKAVMKEKNMFTGEPKLESSSKIGSVDYFISLCEADSAACRVVRRENAVNVSWQVADPAKTVALSKADQTEAFRKTRDHLKARVKNFVGLLRSEEWSEKKPKVRAKALLEIHDQQLLFEFLESLDATREHHSDEQMEPINWTVIYILKHMTVGELWKAGGALVALVVGAFSAGLLVNN